MTKSRLLCSAAAILALGIGAASAQQGAPQPAPSAQQSAPPGKIAPPMNAGQNGPAVKPGTSGQAPSDLKPGRGASAKPDNATTGQAPQAPAGAGKGTNQTDTQSGNPHANNARAKDSKAHEGNATDANGNGNRSGPTNAANEPDKNSRPATTTGQGAAGARANLTTEQRSKITTVIKKQKVEPVKLDVDIRVGTRIPQHVRYYPLPAEVVTIYPQWRGFDYIVVGDTIVVIDPGTREIVAVIDA